MHANSGHVYVYNSIYSAWLIIDIILYNLPNYIRMFIWDENVCMSVLL